jgi:hypothetical protein
MAALALRSEERLGLGLALAAHAALVAWLVLSPPAPAPLPPPERMTVTLSEDVGLTSTAPQPAAQPAPDAAPVRGDVAEPQAQPSAAPVTQSAPPRTTPAPAAKALPTAPRATPAKPAPTRPAGGSRIGADFLNGVAGAQGQTRSAAPAAAFGPQQQSALRAAIMRQLKPHWSAPQGADAEKLVTQVRFDLNRNGALVGEPQIVSQSGQTAANAAQVRRHAEQAIRAVRLASPFILPPDLYDHWQTVTSTFDRRLSQ